MSKKIKYFYHNGVVMDAKGEKGDNGADGVDGAPGAQGPAGPQGPQGDSVLVGEGDLPLAHVLGNDNTKAMSQKAVTTEFYEDGINIGKYIKYDIDNLGLVDCSLGSSGWYKATSGTQSHSVIPVEPGDKFFIRNISTDTNEGNGHYAWLSSDYTGSTPSNGDTIPYVTGSSRANLRVSDGVELKMAPVDAAYLCINRVDGSGNTVLWEIYISKEVDNLDERTSHNLYDLNELLKWVDHGNSGEAKGGYIDPSTAKWKTSTSQKGKVLPFENYAGKRLRIREKASTPRFAFLTAEPTYSTNNSTVSYCSGWSGTFKKEFDGLVPDDCKYLYFYVYDSGAEQTDRTPYVETRELSFDFEVDTFGEEVDLSNVEEVQGWYINQNKWTQATTNQSSVSYKMIPTTPGAKYAVKPSSAYEKGSHLVFLTTNTKTKNAQPSYAGGVTEQPVWTSEMQDTAPIIMTAPSNAAYLYIRYKRADVVVAPISIRMIEKGSLDGIVFNMEKQVESLTDAVTSLAPDYQHPYLYQGNKIKLVKDTHKFDWQLWKTLSSATAAQSHAIHGDYLINFNCSSDVLTAKLYDLETNTLLQTISPMNYGSLVVPHCNVACFSKVFASGNDDLPLLYLSQWDGEHGCIVYDIHTDGTYSIVQTIVPDVSAELFGAGNADWVVDNDYGFIYSIGYKVENGSRVPESQGNKAMICKFKLPDTSTAEVVLTDNDVIDHYELPPFNIMQDKVYANRRIIIAAGGTSSDQITDWRRIYSLNLDKRAVEAIIQLHSLKAQEPECLDIYDGKLILSYAENSHYGDLYAIEL